jgi:hypothetical protein
MLAVRAERKPRRESWHGLGMLRGALPVCLALSACVSLQSLSAGEVGCSPEEIVVSQENRLAPVVTWYAQCRGHNYWCNLVSDKSSCKEELPAAASQRPPDAGPSAAQ